MNGLFDVNATMPIDAGRVLCRAAMGAVRPTEQENTWQIFR
jgi:hypothetical protein